jgi:hypothetical protein
VGVGGIDVEVEVGDGAIGVAVGVAVGDGVGAGPGDVLWMIIPTKTENAVASVVATKRPIAHLRLFILRWRSFSFSRVAMR